MIGAFINSKGEMYTWGVGLQGELGLPDYQIAKHQSTILEKETPEHQLREAYFDYQKFRTPPTPPKLNILTPKEFMPYVITPLKLSLPAPVTKLACGDYHTMFVTSTGELWGCGANAQG